MLAGPPTDFTATGVAGARHRSWVSRLGIDVWDGHFVHRPRSFYMRVPRLSSEKGGISPTQKGPTCGQAATRCAYALYHKCRMADGCEVNDGLVGFALTCQEPEAENQSPSGQEVWFSGLRQNACSEP